MNNLKFIFLLSLFAVQVQAQTINISGPAGSGQFGKTVTVLTNGNFVVTDPSYDEGSVVNVGAVYLYDGGNYALISTIKGSNAGDSIGSNGIVALANANFFVSSQYWDNGTVIDAGAVTWCSGITGISGVVSSSNSLVGSSTGDFSNNAIIILSNGNYLVKSPNWDNGTATDAGAVTWGNGTTGISGVVSSSNSLVGSTAEDMEVVGVTILNNGDYIVISNFWDNGSAKDAGAITWGNGTTGISGVVSSSNSLVGSSANDNIGWYGVTVLNNGKYIVISDDWDNGSATNAGAVTFVNGTSGKTGVVNSSNSLVGSTTNDHIGNRGVTVLPNGNYVVCSYYWDNGSAADAGAVTQGNGTTGITGIVSSSNSLVGSTANNWVGIGGITVLNNGNYVVISPRWDNGVNTDAGAATWVNGITGLTGVVNSSNSLVGSNANDQVGGGGGTLSTVVALFNGNYVVNSPNWWNSAGGGVTGAVTWGNGNTGITGVINSSNSLVGSFHTGGGGITVLSNSNYVVSSPEWYNGPVPNAGAATWANGTTGITGYITSSNSLIGSKGNDQVGRAASLYNGNYVVVSSTWDNGTIVDAGAATFCNGTTGQTGIVSSSNSLVGSTTNDRVGYNGMVTLSNGNYLVFSPFWANGAATGAGAVTWGNGTSGITGVVNSSNSLVGTKVNDYVGLANNLPGVTTLSNGNYVVRSPGWNINWGAVTWGNGAIGISGVVSSSNSLVGSTYDMVGYQPITALSNGNYLVNTRTWNNNGATMNAGAVTWGNGITGISGIVNSSNSLVGSTANDWVGQFEETNIGNGNYVVRNPFWDNGTTIDAGALTWVSGSIGVSGVITSCNSIMGTVASGGLSLTYMFNNIYNYLIIGRESENIVSIYSPTNMSLAITLDDITTNINGNTATPLIASAACRIIATLTPNGTNSINGIINAKVWVESTVPTYGGDPFVARHYEITPATNAATATGNITLYFTQQEFNDFNAHANSILNLPTDDADAAGIANLRIGKYPGTSNNGSGLPGTYSGTPVIIDPDDADIVWNGSLNRWEVSFDVTGFSGFVVQTKLTALPLQLLNFSAVPAQNDVLVSWKTTNEINTSSFDVERSTDGRNFIKLGTVTAVNSASGHIYNYTDVGAALLNTSKLYYRLKIIDNDGRYNNSQIVLLHLSKSNSITVYPNPVSNMTTLSFSNNTLLNTQAVLIDIEGKRIKQFIISNYHEQIDMSHLPGGMYILKLGDGTAIKLIKN